MVHDKESILWQCELVAITDCVDPEESVRLYVTRERNFILVWMDTPDGLQILKHFSLYEPDHAIKWAVDQCERPHNRTALGFAKWIREGTKAKPPHCVVRN